jgi:hypothetical protein
MPTAERELTLRVMVNNIQMELETLKEEAALQDDMVALECLHTIAYESTRQLLSLTQYSPELVGRIAEQQAVWPVLYGKGIMKRTADLTVEAIGLGHKRKGPFEPNNVLSELSDARLWLGIIAGLMDRIRQEALRVERSRELLKGADDNAAAIISGLRGIPGLGAETHEVFEHLKLLATDPDVICRLNAVLEVENVFKNPDTLSNLVLRSVKLPKLSSDGSAIEAWMAVMKQFLMNVYEGHPEKSPLRTMGIYQAESNRDLYPKGTNSYESSVRTGIWVRLKSALKKIAEANPGGPASA